MLVAIESPSSAVASAVASTKSARVGAGRRCDGDAAAPAPGSARSALPREIGGDRLVRVDHRARAAGLAAWPPHRALALHHEVAADQQVGRAGADADAWMRAPARGDAHVAEHRAALLRQARHVEAP